MGDFGGFCPVELSFLSTDKMSAALCGFEGKSRIVLVADKMIIELLNLKPTVQAMDSRYDFVWIDKVTPNPTQVDIIQSLQLIGMKKPYKLIAIGGGSTIDLAKAISATYNLFYGKNPELELVTKAIKEKTYKQNLKAIDIVAIPTTAGTGSEVTKWATIWDVDKNMKFSVDDAALYPKETYIVPELTYSAPKRLVLSTGLDALCHAMEAFWAKPSNPIIKDIAAAAIRIIQQNLKNALKSPVDTKARQGMSRGATLAGIAFSNTRTTACHSISYPLTMMYGLDHGFACALTLAQVANLNKTMVPEISDMLEEIFGDAQDGLKTWLDDVCEGIQTLKLTAMGIRPGDIPAIASAAFTAGRMDNNPADITPGQVIEILEKVK